MNHKEYNGSYNYETFLIKAWMDNDSLSYDRTMDTIEACYDNAEATDILTLKEKAAFDLADTLKEQHEEMNPLTDTETTVFHDLINAALSEVNWDEIAKSFIEDLIQERADIAG